MTHFYNKQHLICLIAFLVNLVLLLHGRFQRSLNDDQRQNFFKEKKYLHISVHYQQGRDTK